MKLSMMNANISSIVAKTVNELGTMFTANTAHNEDASKYASAHEAMLTYLITSSISTQYVKEFNNAKKRLDHCAVALDISNECVPGHTITVFESNVFSFSKRQNKDGQVTSLTDVVNNLRRLGVDKDIIDKAIKESTKTKRGNVYYEIEVMD